MLVGEPNRLYIVYPSWADLSYRWEDLPRLLADPLASGYFQGREKDIEYFLGLGFPPEIKPCTLIDGRDGGGIIGVDLLAEPLPGERWLPSLLLVKEANMCTPDTILRWLPKKPFEVTYLEPRDDPLRDYLSGKKRTKLYLCDPTPEHIESDPGGVYWVVGIKRGRQTVAGLEQLPDSAKAFGLKVFELPGVPEKLQEETSSWFTTPEVQFAWFRVLGGGNGAGYHYAVVLYLAMHLRFVIGPRMRFMHLLANIEGKPRVRVHWPHQQ